MSADVRPRPHLLDDVLVILFLGGSVASVAALTIVFAFTDPPGPGASPMMPPTTTEVLVYQPMDMLAAGATEDGL